MNGMIGLIGHDQSAVLSRDGGSSRMAVWARSCVS